jgi:enamine deaminase RidA (YjgF/YER057c/UK114 family)
MSEAGAGPQERLAALGLVLPEVTPPLAAYVPAVRTGSYVYTAGQLPVVDGQLIATGKVGAEVGASEASALARI